MADGSAGSGSDAVTSSLSGTARDVVQARDITGGIHIHAFPAVGDPGRPPRQLPVDVSGFVGRESELERLGQWAHGDSVTEGRILVIAGTAGAGKTSLAVRFAHRERSRFPDGQLFVNLRGYDSGPPLAPNAALERFLRALGVPPGGIPAELEERAELYRSLLAERRVLVLLDNAVTAGQVRPLLPGDAGCLVLVTTRGRLSGLAARDGAHRITVGLLSEDDSMKLVSAATAGYRSADQAGEIAELVRLCARLPLALRIAAERAAARPLMPLRDLIADLRGESSLWDALSAEEGTDADAVRSVFAWSYRALPPAAARAFRLLGLHPGPEFGTEAAAALVGQDRQRTKALLDLLGGAHLLEQTAPERYQFHDLLRAYAVSQAQQEETAQEHSAALSRIVGWYLHTAHAAVAATQSLFPPVPLEPADLAADIPVFADSAAAMDWYTAERSNLLAATRAATGAALDTLAWQLPATLYPLHDAYGSVDDWTEMAQLGLQAARRLDDHAAQASLLYSLGVAHTTARRLNQAFGCQREALEHYLAADDQAGALRATNALGLVHLRQRELDQAMERFEETLDQAQRIGDPSWYAVALDNLAFTSDAMGLSKPAADYARRALRSYRDSSADPRTHVDPLLTLARTHRESGDFVSAEEHLTTAAEIMTSGITYRPLMQAVLRELATLHLLQGRPEEAIETFTRCVNLARETGDFLREALAFDGIGEALHKLGRNSEAADFHRTAAALSRTNANNFEKATILAHLADAVDQTAQREQAEHIRAEALALLDSYTDPRAGFLRESLRDRGRSDVEPPVT